MPLLAPRATPASGPLAPPATATMADVERYLEHAPLTATTRDDYLRAVRRCVQLYAVAGLAAVPSDLAAFERRWPRRAFDVGHFRSADAYKAWRRKVIAAIKGATGAFADQAERDARQDDWAVLLKRVAPHVGSPRHGAMHGPTTLIALRGLADIARSAGVAPSELSAAQIVAWGDRLTPNRRGSLNRAAGILDRLRYLPEVAALLPKEPFGAVGVLRRKTDRPVPDTIAARIDAWVAEATEGEWDDIDEEHVGGQSDSARAVKRAAMMRFVGDAIRLGVLDPDAIKDPAEALAPDVFPLIIRHWRDTAAERTGVSIRTAAHYARCAAVLMRARGLDAAHIQRAIKINPTLARGKAEGERMSAKARVFCERLLNEPGLRQRFLSLHLHFHKAATKLLGDRRPEDLGKNERRRLFHLGTIAAFAAIELYGTPLRIGNALELTL